MDIARGVLKLVAEQRGSLMVNSVYLHREDRIAAKRLVERGLLIRRTYANGTAYEITDAGHATLSRS